MSIHHHNEKAHRYVGLLDDARVAASWKDVPELIRKITKHAPDRKRLIQIAKAELDVVSYTASSARRPNTTESTKIPSPDSLSTLETDLRTSGKVDEESLQAHSCLIWARWLRPQEKDWKNSELNFEPARAAADANSTWTKICVVRTVYIQGLLLGQEGRTQQMAEVHQTILAWLDSNRSLVLSTPQMLYWAQQLLARVATGNGHSINSTDVVFDETAALRLQAFRHWAILADKLKSSSPSVYGNAPGHLTNLSVWRSYYRFVSGVLQQRPGAVKNLDISQPDLVIELRRVESFYENELLRSAQFPKATESNKPVEDWVEEVILNWQILCGPEWSDTDFGDGGRSSVGRNVLEILYRASTKTFHSTLILRRLFQVHKALADFDLAYKALNTYIELMERGRARAAKSGESITGQDNDHVFLRTIAEGVEGLCSYGGQVEAEQAYDLCLKLEDVLDEIEPPSPEVNASGVATLDGHANGHLPSLASLAPDLTDTVYRAIGVGKSHWSKWTPFSENRSTLQSQASEALQKAARQTIPPHQHLKTLYALSRLLAETREINQAILVVKKALASQTTEQQPNDHYQLQRNLIPFWHLLSLLLTSRQEFLTAGQSCAAAFEQFVPSTIIFGSPSGKAWVAQKANPNPRTTGLVDDMECDELGRIIEIRMTELALTELNEGHEHAVNSSNDLLALYSRLFGRLGGLTAPENISKTKLVQPPKSSAGTLKSSRASLFSRRKATEPGEPQVASRMTNGSSIPEETPRPNTQATDAPTIQVTNEDEKPSPHKHRLFRSSHEHGRDEKRTSSGPHQSNRPRQRLSRSRSRGRTDPETSPESSGGRSQGLVKEMTPSSAIQQQPSNAELSTIPVQSVPVIAPEAGHDSSDRAKQQLNPVAHNVEPNDELPPPAKHDSQPPEQDTRLPVGQPNALSGNPVPRFPRPIAQRQAWTILVKIWLVIATLYRRSKMFEDSREACDEAAKAALRIENLIATIESSARAFRQASWGEIGKSSDELWADVYCERAELSLAIAREREEKEGQGISEGVRTAVEQYEQCLMYFGNHAGGIVGLSNVLLDYYERKVELAKKVEGANPRLSALSTAIAEEASDDRPRKHRRDVSRASVDDTTSNGNVDSRLGGSMGTAIGTHMHNLRDDELKKTPENLNRLAARDRAYGLLSTLTKLGSGWDNSEAWLALSRAHELGGEIDKAKEILWWCVELEDTRPIRHWRNIGGGYVL